MKQQTPLEEHDCTDFAKINCKCPVGYCKLKKSSEFSKWCDKKGWDWSEGHQLYLHDDGKAKTDSELFKDYMESLKP